MHWTYAGNRDPDNLCQGDLLARTQELLGIIRVVHPHFLAAKYRGFMVITQSCDLVQRTGRCRAPYIAIAVVRSVQDALRHELIALDGQKGRTLCDNLFVSDELRTRFDQTVERLLNNTLDGYFFLRADEGAGVKGDLCAFLRVAISLKIDHYHALLRAKHTQLAPIFQAKVGWLVGTHFTEVGTPDWTQSESDRTTRNDLQDNYMDQFTWLPAKQFKTIKTRLEKERLAGTREEIETLIDQPGTMPPTRRELLAAAIAQAWPPDAPQPPERAEFIGLLESQAEFRSALK